MVNIGVVIPSYNDKILLEACLDSLYRVNARTTYSVLVVDDYSSDGTGRWASGLSLPDYAVIRSNARVHFTRAVNAGAKWFLENTDAKTILLLNSDCVVTRGWGRALLDTSRDMRAAIIGATLLNPDGTIQHAGGYGVGQHYYINRQPTNGSDDRSVAWVTGAAMLVHRTVFEYAGYLPVGELGQQYDRSDMNYCYIVRLSGGEIAVSGKSIIYHHTHAAMRMRETNGQVE